MLKKLSLAVAVASAVMSGAAFAESVDSPVGKFDVGMTATFVTDYVSRGTSLNGGAGTIQAAWISPTKAACTSACGAPAWMTCRRRALASRSITTSLRRQPHRRCVLRCLRGHLHLPAHWLEDDVEYLGSLSAYGATVGVKYRTDATEQLYYYVGYDLELPAGFGLSASVGQTKFDDNEEAGDDYVDWSLGVSKTLAGLDLGLTYASNDIDGNDDHFIFSISKSL